MLVAASSEIEARDTTIILKDKLIEQKSQEIKLKSQVIEQQKDILRSTIKNLTDRNLSISEIATILSISEQQIQDLLSE